MGAQGLGLWGGGDYLGAGGRLPARHTDDSVTLRWPMKTVSDRESVTLTLPATRIVAAGSDSIIFKL